MENNKVREIEEESLEFLYAICFGNYNDLFEAAGNRAYCDFNRTIRFNGINDEIRKSLRIDVIDLIRNAICELKHYKNISQQVFDAWHYDLSKKIKEKYLERSISLTFGQAQKWINMTLKYLHVLDNRYLGDIFQYCHVPLDNYVLDISERMFGINKPQVPWSKWDDYNKQYLKYQMSLREAIKDESPLKWEFQAWMIAAKEK